MRPDSVSYHYQGPAEFAVIGPEPPPRARISDGEDVQGWIRQSGQTPDAEGQVSATFVVDTAGQLWVADRCSEHVQCARGGEVLAAGEITFGLSPAGVEVSAVTNQSTGYCPGPESWAAVQRALAGAGIPGPNYFTTTFIFRRCPSCEALAVVKEDWFECAECGGPLPR